MMNKYQALSGLITLLFSSLSSATVITYAGYTHDTETNIVTDGGLEWLRWDVTIGKPIQWLLSGNAEDIDGGGWVLANNTQISNLYNTFNFWPDSNYTFGTDETQDYGISTGVTTDVDNGIDEPDVQFISLFGDTSCYASGICAYTDDDNPFLSRAFYGNDNNDNGLFNFTTVTDDWSKPSFGLPGYAGSGKIYFFGSATLDAESVNVLETWPDTGLALVRSVNTVPEPSILALFAAGLFGFGFTIHHRRHHNLN